MIIDIDLTGATAVIELMEPADCKRFHVAARGGDFDTLKAALSAAGVGRLLPSGDAMIETESVRTLARGKVPAGWDDDFAAMLEYAKAKGWVNDDGGAIQAHVDWSG